MTRISIRFSTTKHLLYQVYTKLTVETKFVDLQRFVRLGLVPIISNSSKIFLDFTDVTSRYTAITFTL